MLKTYKYKGNEYKGSELPELAKKTFGDEIYEELIRQIKEGVAEKKRKIDYIILTDTERIVYENRTCKDPKPYRNIGAIVNLTPAEAQSTYTTAIKKLRRNVPGHISSLNISPRASNALIKCMRGNVEIKKLAEYVVECPSVFINCQGLGYVGYCDMVNCLEELGYDMKKVPKFLNKSEFARRRSML